MMRSPTSPRLRQRPLGPDDSRTPRPRRAHGLSAAERAATIEAQGGRCPICLRVKPLVVDHDHRHCDSPEGCRLCARGLICCRCNGALGQIGDVNVGRLIAYLSRELPWQRRR